MLSAALLHAGASPQPAARNSKQLHAGQSPSPPPSPPPSPLNTVSGGKGSAAKRLTAGTTTSSTWEEGEDYF